MLQITPLTFADGPRIAQVRMRCYGGAANSLERFQKSFTNDRRAKDGDYLVASIGKEDVGTLTSLSLPMWVRGGPVPCQCVAWVGTVKTMRRTGTGSSQGIASALMHHA